MGMGVGGFKVTAAAAQVKANTEERVRRWRTKTKTFRNAAERRSRRCCQILPPRRRGTAACCALLCECVTHPPLLTVLNSGSHFHSETGQDFQVPVSEV